jgi:ribonuclease HI
MYAFVDGAVDVNRRRDQGGAGFGGVGVVLVRKDADEIVSYRIIGVPFWPHSMLITNNTMEVMAIKIACDILLGLSDPETPINIWSDSQYAKNMLLFGSNCVANTNVALIDYVRRTTARPYIHIFHCRGHAGFAWNELADMAATKAVEKRRGFDATIACKVGADCFRCKRFPCGAPDKGTFGLQTSLLKNRYVEKCSDYEVVSVEGCSGA